MTNTQYSFITQLGAYAEHLKAQGKAHLIMPYQNASRQLALFAAGKGIAEPRNVTPDLIREFQLFLYDKRDFAKSSVATAVKSVVMFFDFLVQSGVVSENIVRGVEILPTPQPPEKQLAHFYTFDEIMRRYLGDQQVFVSYAYLHQIEKHLKGFFKFLRSNEIGSIYPVTEAVLIKYRDYLWQEFVAARQEALVVKSQIHRLQCVVRFFRYLLKEGVLINNPAQNLAWEAYSKEIIEKAKSLPDKREPEKDLSELGQLKQKFLEYQRAIGKDSKTLLIYKKAVEIFYGFMEQKGLKNVAQVQKRVILEYYTYLCGYVGVRGNPVSSGYKSQMLWGMKLFFRFLTKFDYLAKDPSIDLEGIREDRGLPHTCMNENEVFEIIERPGLDGDPLALRDKAVMEVLFSTGIRSEELCSLNLEDVDFKEEMVRVNNPKGGVKYQRVIPIGKVALGQLSAYLKEARAVLEKGDHKALFLSYSGHRIQTDAVLNIVKKYAHQCGFRKNITTHSFRVTFATLLLKNGADIRYVQELLGHLSIKSTQIYTRLNPIDLKGIHARFHPRERKRLLAA